MKPKIFCIGLGKTGTSSLAKALEYMGYHVGRRQQVFTQHYPDFDLIKAIQSKNYETIFEIIPKFDAFVDNPWPLLYQELAQQYPDAKFVLSTRKEGEWLQSVKRYFGSTRSDFRKLIYGKSSPIGNEKQYLKRYQSHNKQVLGFFASKPERLLVLPLEAQNKWELIADFLKEETPNIVYPNINKTEAKKKKSKWYKLIRPLHWEVAFTLFYARILTLLFPFKKLARSMSKPPKKQSQLNKSEKMGEAIKLSQLTKSLSKKMPFRAKCFEQALCLQKVLKRRGINSEIVFGLKTKADQLAAHAWCISQGVTLSGEKGKEQFSVLKSFKN
ncbi:MAG: lasso peptide biosynthesis B2 protein [Vicingaceae bacterium]